MFSDEMNSKKSNGSFHVFISYLQLICIAVFQLTDNQRIFFAFTFAL